MVQYLKLPGTFHQNILVTASNIALHIQNILYKKTIWQKQGPRGVNDSVNLATYTTKTVCVHTVLQELAKVKTNISH